MFISIITRYDWFPGKSSPANYTARFLFGVVVIPGILNNMACGIDRGFMESDLFNQINSKLSKRFHKRLFNKSYHAPWFVKIFRTVFSKLCEYFLFNSFLKAQKY